MPASWVDIYPEFWQTASQQDDSSLSDGYLIALLHHLFHHGTHVAVTGWHFKKSIVE